MNIEFGLLTIDNFMSYGHEEYDFNSLDGMIRVKGKNYDIPNQLNGAGKSVLFSALVYAIYGELPKKLRNDNIINRYVNTKNMTVDLHLSVDGRGYRIVSGLKSRQGFCELYELKNDGEYKNITLSTIAETRKHIEKNIVMCDKNLFMRTIYLNSDDKYNFHDMKDSEKKEFIDKIFDTKLFGDMYANVKSDLNGVKKQIASYQNRLLVLNKNAEEYEIKSKMFIGDRQKRIHDITSELNEKRNELDNLRKITVQKNSEIEKKCKDGIKKAEILIMSTDDDIKIAQKDADVASRNIRAYKNIISEKNKIIDNHSELKGKLCDDCKPIFSRYYNLDKYQDEIDAYNSKIDAENAKIQKVNEKISIYIKKKSDTEEKMNKIRKMLSDMTRDYDSHMIQLGNLDKQVNKLENELEFVTSRKNPYDDLIVENNTAIEKENEGLSSIADEYKYLKFCESILGNDNLSRFITKDLVNVLNGKIKYYIHKLGANYDIVIDEDLKCDFTTNVKSGIEYNNFSKGEEARISIATCFAFRDLLAVRSRTTSNILILDEFFDGNVDPVAIENTMEILRSFVSNNKQKIYVVSHRLEVSDDIFNHILQVEKRDNISKINVIR